MFTFKITPPDGDARLLVADSRDVWVWEHAGRGRSLRGFLANLNMSDCYALAHIACRRQQLFSGTLDEFASSHVIELPDVTIGDDDDGEDSSDADAAAALGLPDPTRPAHSPGG